MRYRKKKWAGRYWKQVEQCHQRSDETAQVEEDDREAWRPDDWGGWVKTGWQRRCMKQRTYHGGKRCRMCWKSMQMRGRWMRTPAFQIEKQGSGNKMGIGSVELEDPGPIYMQQWRSWGKRSMYINDCGDRRGARLKFRFRTGSAGLRAEVGGQKNKEEAR